MSVVGVILFVFYAGATVGLIAYGLFRWKMRRLAANAARTSAAPSARSER